MQASGPGPGAGAPLELTEDLLTTFNISAVVRGSVAETGAAGAALAQRRYAAARARGIFRCARRWSHRPGRRPDVGHPCMHAFVMCRLLPGTTLLVSTSCDDAPCVKPSRDE